MFKAKFAVKITCADQKSLQCSAKHLQYWHLKFLNFMNVAYYKMHILQFRGNLAFCIVMFCCCLLMLLVDNVS